MASRVLVAIASGSESASCARPWWAAALLLVGCLQQSPAARLQDAAQALNLATRFGRLDVAADYAAEEAQEQFVSRRAGWGEQVRVVDVNVSGLTLQEAEQAEVDVEIAWTPGNESTLRTTSVRQSWEHSPGKGWRLTREKRLSGDVGVFGEVAPTPKPAPPAAHFPTTTLRGSSFD